MVGNYERERGHASNGTCTETSHLRERRRHAGAPVRYERRRIRGDALPDQLDQADQPEGAQGAQGRRRRRWEQRCERVDGTGRIARGRAARQAARGHRAFPVSRARRARRAPKASAGRKASAGGRTPGPEGGSHGEWTALVLGSKVRQVPGFETAAVRTEGAGSSARLRGVLEVTSEIRAGETVFTVPASYRANEKKTRTKSKRAKPCSRFPRVTEPKQDRVRRRRVHRIRCEPRRQHADFDRGRRDGP